VLQLVDSLLRCSLDVSVAVTDVTDASVRIRVRVRVRVTLRLTVSQSICLGVQPCPGVMTRYSFLFESYCPVHMGRAF
jgi:hypothetical protein